jgi:anaerobic magnesium-protoporphyrin IX monomethyl ester cyclase
MSTEKHLVLATIDMDERPVSIRVLGAHAESIGVRVTLLVIIKPLATIGHPVAFSRQEVGQLSEFLKREKATHLGFYLMTAGLRPYAELVQALRDAGYSGVIMAGGVHPTLCPEKSLVEGADFAVQGPGEVPLEMILDGKDAAAIPGLVWRDGGKTVVNPQSAAQKLELNELPYPLFRFDRDWMLVDGKLRRLTWGLHRTHATWDGQYYDMVTSRGCVYRCAYCCNVNGSPVRRSGVDRVIGELRELRRREPRVTGVNFQDDCFYAGSDAWLKEFCSRMKSEVGLPFIARMIPRYVTSERLEIMKSAGVAYVTMGLEASDRLNRQVFNRKETSASFLKAARTILAADLHLSIDVLIHNPYEMEADLREVALTLNALPRPNWDVVALSLTPFPGTPLYERAVRDRTLDTFATDAFDSMLVPSRPGGYLTPRFWLALNTQLLMHVSEEMGAKLIAAGPHNPQAARIVERMAAQADRAKRMSTWLKEKTPTLYAVAAGAAKLTSGLTRLLRRIPSQAESEAAAPVQVTDGPSSSGDAEQHAATKPEGPPRARNKKHKKRKK